MRKPAFGTCENKGADQLHSNCPADQRLCFRYSTTCSLIQNFKLLAIYCDFAARFVTNLVGTPEDRVSHYEAQSSKVFLFEYRHEKICLSHVRTTIGAIQLAHTHPCIIIKSIFSSLLG